MNSTIKKKLFSTINAALDRDIAVNGNCIKNRLILHNEHISNVGLLRSVLSSFLSKISNSIDNTDCSDEDDASLASVIKIGQMLIKVIDFERSLHHLENIEHKEDSDNLTEEDITLVSRYLEKLSKE